MKIYNPVFLPYGIKLLTTNGHEKNLAFVYVSNQHLQLAPFYDLVCTRAIRHVDVSLALSVGNESHPGNVNLDCWLQLAENCNISTKYIKNLIHHTAELLLNNIRNIIIEFERMHGPYPALQRIHQIVTNQCKKTLRF